MQDKWPKGRVLLAIEGNRAFRPIFGVLGVVWQNYGAVSPFLCVLCRMIPQTFTVTSNISAFTFQFFCFTIFSCRLRAVD